MSTNDDKKKTGNDAVVVEKKKKEIKGLEIVIDRSKELEGLTDDLVAEKLSKEELNKQLALLKKKYEELEGKAETDKTKYDELQVQHDEFKGKLLEHAKVEFTKRRTAYIDSLKEGGLEQEKIDEIETKVTTPSELDDALIWLELFPKMLKKGQDEEIKVQQEKEQLAKDKASLEDAKKGGGQVKLDAPDKDFVYKGYGNVSAYREAIDDLYERVAKGDTKAELKLKELWNLAVKKMKSDGRFEKFSMEQCYVCGGGVLKGEVCPYCGADQRDRIQRRD